MSIYFPPINSIDGYFKGRVEDVEYHPEKYLDTLSVYGSPVKKFHYRETVERFVLKRLSTNKNTDIFVFCASYDQVEGLNTWLIENKLGRHVAFRHDRLINDVHPERYLTICILTRGGKKSKRVTVEGN